MAGHFNIGDYDLNDFEPFPESQDNYYPDPPMQDPDQSADAGGPSTTSAAASRPVPSTRERKSTSNVWSFFKKEMRPGNDGKLHKFAICNYCKKVLNADSCNGTGALWRHHRACLNKHGGGPEPSQSQLSFVPGQPGISGPTLTNWKFDVMRAREALAVWIAQTDSPLSLGATPEFEEFIRTAYYPPYRSVSRSTIRRDLIRIFGGMRLELIESLGRLHFSVALTSDIWNARSKTDYLCVVAHYVDNDWILQKRIIGFRQMDMEHSGENIYNTILGVIGDYNITPRVISLTLDNASANAKAIDYFRLNNVGQAGEPLFHQRCACHIINLIVKAGLDVVKDQLNTIREAIAWISSSNQRVGDFNRFCRAHNMRPRIFATDMPVRWNSTFIMLRECLPYSEVITVFLLGKRTSFSLTPDDWVVARHFFNFLQIFYNKTVVLSGVYYPTSPECMFALAAISQVFFYHRQDPIIAPVVRKMEAKYRKYWEDIPILYCLGFVLDPRGRLEGLTTVLNTIGEYLNIDYSSKITNVRNKIYEIYNSYERRLREVRGTPSEASASATPEEFIQSGKRKNDWAWGGDSFLCRVPRFTSTSTSSVSPSTVAAVANPPLTQELGLFLQTEWEIGGPPQEFNILRWWRDHADRFPVLSTLARDVLTIPVSTVSSESAFSTAGRIIEDRRRNLTPEMVEVFTCVKDWEQAKRRRQHQMEDEEILENFSNMYLDQDEQGAGAGAGAGGVVQLDD